MQGSWLLGRFLRGSRGQRASAAAVMPLSPSNATFGQPASPFQANSVTGSPSQPWLGQATQRHSGFIQASQAGSLATSPPRVSSQRPVSPLIGVCPGNEMLHNGRGIEDDNSNTTNKTENVSPPPCIKHKEPENVAQEVALAEFPSGSAKCTNGDLLKRQSRHCHDDSYED